MSDTSDVHVRLSRTTLALLVSAPRAPGRRRRKARVVRPQGAMHPVLVLSRALASWGRR